MFVRTFLITALLGMASLGNSSAHDQPFMATARSDLQRAKTELQAAQPDKGGHRVKAIGYVNQAIAEVNSSIAYDRRHNHIPLGAFPVSPDQPHLESALNSLNNARDNLEKASSDKGGHRAKAIGYVRMAVEEVKLAFKPVPITEPRPKPTPRRSP